MSLFAGRNGDTDVENGIKDTVREGESGTYGESSVNIHILSGVRWIAGEKLLGSTGSPLWCSVMTWKAGLGGGEGGEGAGDVCIIMADMHCCVAETNTML